MTIQFIYGEDTAKIQQEIKRNGWGNRKLKISDVVLEPRNTLFETTPPFYVLDKLTGLETKLAGYDPTLHLPIAIVQYGKPDKRTKAWKWLQKNAKCSEYKQPTRRYDILKRLRAIVEGLDIYVPSVVLERLVDSYVGDILQSQIQLEMLATVYDSVPSDVVFDNPEALVFDLARYIVRQEPQNALHCLERLTEQNEPTYKVLSIVANQLRDYSAIVLHQTVKVTPWLYTKMKQDLQQANVKRIPKLAYSAQQQLSKLHTGQHFDFKQWVLCSLAG